MSTLRVDTILEYPAGPYPVPGRCHLRLYDQGGGDVVLVATDLGAENTGASVTNAIEEIVTAAARRYALDPARLRVIEHYDDRRAPRPPAVARRESDGLEDFDEVTFAHVPAAPPAAVGDGVGEPTGAEPDADPLRGSRFGEPHWHHRTRRQVEGLIGQPLP